MKPNILGGGVVKISVGREGQMHGVTVGGSMGLSIWTTFSGNDELAAIDGDFIMTAKEVQSVLRALWQVEIHIVALHNHMVGESPSFYFTHFWGTGPAEKLAGGFQSTLAAQANVREQDGISWRFDDVPIRRDQSERSAERLGRTEGHNSTFTRPGTDTAESRAI